jgi:tRNA threonylcarbamoyladenosine biosynthesis protein TsaB
MLLAIDSATRLLSLALHDGEQIASELTWHSANYHTVELTPSISAMMAQAGITPADLKAIAVAIGPGSFTGLRIGLAVAKGLALAHKLPLAGVPTLDIVAASIGPEDIPLCAILRAGRGRICVGRYRWHEGEWRAEGEPEITTFEEVVASLESPTLFAGEIGQAGAKLLRRRRSKAYLLSPAASLRRAGYLAEIGWERFKRNRMDNAATLSPVYLNIL